MLKIYSAHTSETDDVEAAVSEILEQLDLSRLLAFSAGIMFYYADFAETGVIQALCEKLPFPVVGGTTSNSAISGAKEGISLTITVFTSNTIAFTAGISDSLQDEPFISLEKLYKQLLEGKPETMGEKPSMLFIVAPYFLEITGDEYLAVLNGLSGGVPVFGSMAFTHTVEFKNIKTFFNGVEYDKALASLAFWGDIEPQFFISDIPDEQFMNRRMMVTDSCKNRIKRINGIPVLEYLESIGLAKNGEMPGLVSFPLILYMPGGSRLIRSIYNIEDGELLCSGDIPSNIPMQISFCNKEFALESARKTAADCKKWLDSRDFSVSRSALIISCAARRWILGSDVYAEIREIDDELKDIHYHFAYSGGEFCPVYIRDGIADNCFFNYTLCICVI